MTSCAVRFCNNKLSKTKNISYFRFPTDPLKSGPNYIYNFQFHNRKCILNVYMLFIQRCKKWIENSKSYHLLGKDPAILQKSYRLYRIYFEDKNVFNKSSENRITAEAGPTLLSGKILFKNFL